MKRTQTEQDVIYLVSCAVNGSVPDRSRAEGMDLDAVYALAERHSVAAAAAYALESAGLKDKRSTDAVAAAMRRTAIFDKERADVVRELEKAGIWHMPLKGSVLKELYPRYGMRQMSDVDILFDPSRADDVKAVMEGLGYKTERFAEGSQDIYFKDPVSNFELHRSLFGSRQAKRTTDYYRDVTDRMIPTEGSKYGYHFSDEDMYIYMTAHEYKHYSNGGTGLRSLTDAYVFLKKKDGTLDRDYISGELEKLGIAEFEAANRSLALHLFGGGKLTDAENGMLEYVLTSETYGTLTHRLENNMKKKGRGKLGYTLSRFFVPVSRKNASYDRYAEEYPLFYRHKILLPILPFYRLFRSIKSGRFVSEAKNIKNAKL